MTIVFMAFSWVLSSGVLASTGSDPAVEELIAEALRNNPKVRAKFHKWKAARSRVKVASALPDPVARYGYFGQEVHTRVGPQEQRYGVSQKFPFPGKRHLKGRVEEKQAEIAKQDYESAKREIIQKVKMTYYDIYFADRALQILRQEKDTMKRVEAVVRGKYEADLAPYADVVKAQFILAQLEEREQQLHQQRESAVALMNKLLERPDRAPLGTVASLKDSVFAHTLEDLLGTAAANRQELLAAQIAVDRAEYEHSLAKMDFLPDFTFGVDFIEIGDGTTSHVDDGTDAWMVSVAVNLPVWAGKKTSAVQEKSELLKASRAEEDDTRSTVQYEVRDMFYKIRSYDEIVTLYETALIPQAEQGFDTAGTAYEAGELDFLNWMDEERKVLMTKLAYYKSIADYHKSIAALERLVGRNL